MNYRYTPKEIGMLNDEIERLRAALNDCVALITGQASGEAQREGIIRESIAILGKHYAGPVVEQSTPPTWTLLQSEDKKP